MKRQQQRVHKDLQSLYQEAPIGLCSLDTNLRYIQINDWLAALNGLPVEAHLGRTLREVLPDVAAGVEHQLRKVIETGELIIDGRVDAETPAHPGVVRSFQHHYYPNRSEGGRIVGVSCLVADITERKQAEDALRSSEELFTQIAKHLREILFVVDHNNYRVLYVNPAYEEIWNRTCESLYEHPASWIDAIAPEDAERVKRALEKQQRTGEFNEEFRIVWPDGSVRWIHDRVYPIQNEQGEIYRLVGIAEDITAHKQAEEELRRAHDELEVRVTERTARLAAANAQLEAEITERKKAEETLRETNERFRLLLETTSAVPWEADARTWRFTYVGPQAVKVLNYPVQQWYEKDFWATHLHPEDRQRAVDFCESSSRKLADYEFEYRMVSADGRVVWFDDLVSVVSANGVPTLLRGVMIDITERKRAEEALRASHARFGGILDIAHEGIISIDAKERILIFNQGAARIFGYAPDEVLGQSMDILLPERARHRHSRHIAEFAGSTDSARRMGDRQEIYGRRKTGEEFPAEASISKLEVGGERIFTVVLRDVTERKRAEEALRELTGRLITAQEQERARIARELHDDVNQKLALLAVDLELLGQTPPHSPAETTQQARNLSAQVKAISSDVHRLSHRLHPSKIEQLGLVAAMKSLCRELSLKYDVRVEFSDRDAQGPIPEDIALCLYRIVQEALANVVKHSGARDAWVELLGGPTAIHLRISDPGRGFNPNSVKGSEGLGLVSMQERVHLVRGEIAIDSQPAQGTRINVRVLLPSAPS